MRRKEQDDFNRELWERICGVCRQKIWDPQADKVVMVAEARADLLLDKTTQVADRNKMHNAEYRAADRAARDYAAADASDPFAYNRARSHILSGVCLPSDYGATIKYKEIEFQDEDGKTHKMLQKIISGVKCP